MAPTSLQHCSNQAFSITRALLLEDTGEESLSDANTASLPVPLTYSVQVMAR
jgi:hypothetical protein